MKHKIFSFLSVIALITGLFAPLSYGSVQAAPNATTSVTIAGSFQSELGCSGGVNGDWDPACASTHLTYDANDDVWQASFEIPAGSWEYKAALNDSWTENYGANATPGGDNIPLVLTQTTTVKFYYDDKSHWVTDNANAVIATVHGDFQKSLGCANDWEPSVAADREGRVYVAWDTYDKGNYDVVLRKYENGRWSELATVAATRQCCRSGPRGSGSASSATAPRMNSWRSRASTSGAGCLLT